MASIAKDPVKLRRKTLSNGNVSLYLDIYFAGRRSYEFLKLYLVPEKTKADREQNRHMLSLANSVKAQRTVDIQRGAFGFDSVSTGRVQFFDYYRSIAEKRSNGKRGHSLWGGCLKHLSEYEKRDGLLLSEVTPKWVEGFKVYLENQAVNKKNVTKQTLIAPNTRRAYYHKLAAVFNQAVRDGLIARNPMTGIAPPAAEESTKAYLTIDELKRMAATDCRWPGLKRAFLFAALTGLRWSDVTGLRWSDVTMMDGRTRIVFRQKKTGGQEYLDITAQAAELLGAVGEGKIFADIPLRDRLNEKLREWARDAGIDKHITFHSSRHTFAVMMLTLDTDLYTVSKLLGHREIKTTQVYAKIVDAKKQAAVDNIPKIL